MGELIFSTPCPYCKSDLHWVFEDDKLGERLEQCKDCGKSFVVETTLEIKATTYALIKQ